MIIASHATFVLRVSYKTDVYKIRKRKDTSVWHALRRARVFTFALLVTPDSSPAMGTCHGCPFGKRSVCVRRQMSIVLVKRGTTATALITSSIKPHGSNVITYTILQFFRSTAIMTVKSASRRFVENRRCENRKT